MTPERWEQIGRVYEEAKLREASERARWLDETCAGDGDLLREVEAMLAAEANIGDFIAEPALRDAAVAVFDEPEGSMVGRKLGHYELISLIGAGGMGEVYAARDSRLGRRVAVKLLPRAVAGDPDRLRRFEQEARAVSMLNHPNIVTIHDVGTYEGTPYLVTELLEGETLRERLRKSRPDNDSNASQSRSNENRALDSARAVDYALQIAQGLSAAHSQGLVHRDLKPENLFITNDGRLKILDFGLARVVQQSQQDGGPESSSDIRTHPGLVMGTAGYMAPEQVRGETADTRADIFAFGVILYEMLAGERPFRAPSGAETMTAILQQNTPELPAHVRAQSPGLARAVLRCLEKRPENRFQTASDLGFALEALTSLAPQISNPAAEDQPTAPLPVSGPTPIANTRRWTAWSGWIVAAVLLIAGSVYFATRFRPPPVAPRVTPFTSAPGHKSSPVFSPDGNQLAFVWDGGGEEGPGVYVQLIDAGTPLRLASLGGAQESNLAWSPDGRHIAFVRGRPRSGIEERDAQHEGGIFIVPALGGPERRLTDLKGSFDWSPDGATMAVAVGESPQTPISIHILTIETGEISRLTSPPEGSFGDIAPAFSPDGQKIAFIRNQNFLVGDIFVVPVTGGEAVRLTSDNLTVFGSLAWTASGNEIVFASPRGGLSSLWKISAAGRGLRRAFGTGEYAFSPAIARRGNRLAYVYRKVDVNIWRAAGPKAPSRELPAVPLIASTREDLSAQYSPDGRRITFVSDRSGSREIWVCESDGRNPIQLTNFGGSHTGSPRWSPDSRQIAFDSRPEGQSEIYVINAGGGRPRNLTQDEGEDVLPSWSADGKSIYFASRRNGGWQIWKMPAEGGESVQVTKHGGYEAFESNDGRTLYYAKRESGIWSMPSTGGEEKMILNYGLYSRWALLETGICVINPRAFPNQVMEYYDFTTRRTSVIRRFEQAPVSGSPGISVARGGEWILYWQADRIDNDIMLVENFH
ncbi:MAG: PD40 domain-containing protein [Acidobacteria bacterium]|nr:PD40 domain-containing protein [Acidobacteriota bacterium]